MLQKQVSDLRSIQRPAESEIKSHPFILYLSERGALPIQGELGLISVHRQTFLGEKKGSVVVAMVQFTNRAEL